MLIIDGHNLMVKLTGRGLDHEEEGREEVLRKLSAYSSKTRQPILIIFDGDHPDRLNPKSFGTVKVAYSAGNKSADDEIVKRIKASTRKDKLVVTSDRTLRNKCHSLGGATISSEDFVARINKTDSTKTAAPTPKPTPTEKDTDHWLAIFEEKTDKK
jgi:predicted RNA-binding protein with PIN domain